ncbi:hypothetical protein BABINDRAFT_159560 [Babjeviella inositovora NRRL Y-12698]|uniref:WKF domain-containing protein n=1 Tax=Babjeviella inositovora NRRL Y-12698 TaxID=984486 RepID=A0A1E3R166_9ASCO|nr:uncharacterized protein BABINDRAFT_159560 [Babjeviella inositovora NRRL Y-12698]ODQ83102.1 hypothetical protein BABINDRAFT_159560 [Babjeviella inositovora NRRL Y-12698]
MSAHIPVWKRIGLKVKQVLSEDPLALSTHIDSTEVSTKQAKKLIQQRKRTIAATELDAEGNASPKKSAKRVKLPKAERAPPPEKDQLVYLRQYKEDKDNWKFSKQKQNWVLKNMKSIPEQYDEALKEYLQGLQGGSKDRVVSDLKIELEKWNRLAEDTEKLLEEPREEGPEENDQAPAEKKDVTTVKKSPAKKEKPKEEPPTFDWAVKAREMFKAMSGEDFFLKGIDDMLEEDEKAGHTAEAQKTETIETTEAEEKDVQRNLVVESVEVNDFITEEDTVDPAVKGVEADAGEEDQKVKAKKSKKKKSKTA